MATQLETLRLIAPEFDAINDVDAQSFLDLAPLFIDPLIYPIESRGLALVYQACSLMYRQSQSAGGNSGGQVLIGEKEGDLERRWSAGTRNRPAQVTNIYEEQLQKLSLGLFGSTILTRYGTDVPQGYEIDYQGYRSRIS